MVTRSPEWPWMWVSPHPGPIHQGFGTGRLQNWHLQDSDTCQSVQATCQQPRWFPTAGCHWMPWGLPLELGSLHLLLPGGPPEPAEMQGGDQTTIQQSAAVCCALGGSFYPPWEVGTAISVPLSSCERDRLLKGSHQVQGEPAACCQHLKAGAGGGSGGCGLMSAGHGLLQDLHTPVSPEPPTGHPG